MERLTIKRKTEPRPSPSPRGTKQRAELKLPIRYTILSPALITQFCRFVRKGLPFDGVCDLLGVSSYAFWMWVNKGQKFLDNGNAPSEDSMFGAFVQRIRKASARYRYKLVKGLHTGDPDLWRREMSILSRRDRKNFGKDTAETQLDSYDDAEQFL